MRAQVAEAIDGLRPNDAGWIYIHCPACQSGHEHGRKMYVSARTGWYRCWTCDTVGRLHGDWSEFEEEDGWEDVESEIEEPSDFHELPGTSLALRGAREFLAARRVPDQVVIAAGLGYAARGKHRGRIIMPIPGPDGEWVGWVGRGIPHARTRRPYHTAEGMDRKRTFYNDPAITDPTDRPLIVTEGPFDALRHWPLAVSCLGKPTPTHVIRLGSRVRKDRPIIVALDGDAWREGLGIAEVLRSRGRISYALALPRGEDLDSTNAQTVTAAIRYAIANDTDADLRNA
jgi:hypothetical protein